MITMTVIVKSDITMAIARMNVAINILLVEILVGMMFPRTGLPSTNFTFVF